MEDAVGSAADFLQDIGEIDPGLLRSEESEAGFAILRN